MGGTTLTRNTPARQTTPFARCLSHEAQFDACAGPGTFEVGGSRFGMPGASAGSAGSVGDEKLASCSRWSLERGDYYVETSRGLETERDGTVQRVLVESEATTVG